MYIVNKWNEEWMGFLNEQIYGDQKLKTLVSLSPESIEALKNSFFRYAYPEKDNSFDAWSVNVCKVGMVFNNENVEVEVDLLGNIEYENAMSIMDEMEQDYFLTLLRDFNIPLKAMALIQRETEIRGDMSWYQHHYE